MVGRMQAPAAIVPKRTSAEANYHLEEVLCTEGHSTPNIVMVNPRLHVVWKVLAWHKQQCCLGLPPLLPLTMLTSNCVFMAACWCLCMQHTVAVMTVWLLCAQASPWQAMCYQCCMHDSLTLGRQTMCGALAFVAGGNTCFNPSAQAGQCEVCSSTVSSRRAAFKTFSSLVNIALPAVLLCGQSNTLCCM